MRAVAAARRPAGNSLQCLALQADRDCSHGFTWVYLISTHCNPTRVKSAQSTRQGETSCTERPPPPVSAAPSVTRNAIAAAKCNTFTRAMVHDFKSAHNAESPQYSNLKPHNIGLVRQLGDTVDPHPWEPGFPSPSIHHGGILKHAA